MDAWHIDLESSLLDYERLVLGIGYSCPEGRLSQSTSDMFCSLNSTMREGKWRGAHSCIHALPKSIYTSVVDIDIVLEQG